MDTALTGGITSNMVSGERCREQIQQIGKHMRRVDHVESFENDC